MDLLAVLHECGLGQQGWGVGIVDRHGSWRIGNYPNGPKRCGLMADAVHTLRQWRQ
jgi:hypothetical protein